MKRKADDSRFTEEDSSLTIDDSIFILDDSSPLIDDFFNAIENNDIEFIENILSIYPALVHETDANGNQALSFAITKKCIAIAKLLIDHEADINSFNKGISIFQQCLSLNNSINEFIIFLLGRSELNILGNYHISPLMIDESPKITATILFQMILKSRKQLEKLVNSESLSKINSSPILLAELNSHLLTWEQNEREILAQIEDETPFQDATEESIASYAHVRDPIVNSAISQGYIIHETARDGNCFFSSIVASIYGNCSPEVLSAIASRYRSIAINHMLNNSEYFLHFFTNNEAFYWYLEVMSDPSQEADNPIIKALADVLQRSIIIHGEIDITIEPHGETINFATHILYDGRHYDGLRHQENCLLSYVGVDIVANKLFFLPPHSAQEQVDILEEYDLLMLSPWFLEHVENLIPEEEIIYPEGEQDSILYGLIAIYTLLPHKIIDHI